MATEKQTSFTTSLHLETLSPEDIPAFIGKGALNIKNNIKVPSWKMFAAWEKKNSQEPSKNTLFVKAYEKDEKFFCDITASSEELLKFAVFNVKKSEKNFNTRVFRHTYYASMDNSLIPLFIGQKGKSIQNFLNRLSKKENSPVQPGNPFKKENKGDIRLSIEALDYFSEEAEQSLEDTVTSLIDNVEGDKYSDFIGWQPSTDEYEEYVKISMTVFTTLDDLDDVKQFMSEEINSYIQHIEERDQKRSFQRENVENDINEALNMEC